MTRVLIVLLAEEFRSYAGLLVIRRLAYDAFRSFCIWKMPGKLVDFTVSYPRLLSA